MSSLFLLSLHLLYYYLPLFARASASGTLALFLDVVCEQASIINPTVDLAADVCLVTNGAFGVAVEELPPCASGEATLQLYQDTSCANQVNAGIDYAYENCYVVPAAVLFACTAVAKGSRATATSTVSAGSSSMAIATGAAASPTGGLPGDSTSQNTPSTNEAAPTSSTIPNPTSTDPTTTDRTRASTSSAGGSGLSKGSQIGLGVGLPAGSIVVALLAWLCPCTRKVIRRHRPGANSRRGNSIGLLGHQAEKGYEMWNSSQGLATPTPPAYSNTQLGYGGNSTQGLATPPITSNTQLGFGGNSTQAFPTPANPNTQSGFGGIANLQGAPPSY